MLNTVSVWGNMVGQFTGTQWTPPNDIVDGCDIEAVYAKINAAANAPHVTWVDLAPQWHDYFIDNDDDADAGHALNGVPYPPGKAEIRTITECPLDAVPVDHCPGTTGDFNGDAVVDLRDRALFVICFTSPGGDVPAECRCADVAGDRSVTLSDYAVLQQILGE